MRLVGYLHCCTKMMHGHTNIKFKNGEEFIQGGNSKETYQKGMKWNKAGLARGRFSPRQIKWDHFIKRKERVYKRCSRKH